jgi:hypothetical protein
MMAGTAGAAAASPANSATRLRIPEACSLTEIPIGRDVDPLEQQPEDPRLLGRV